MKYKKRTIHLVWRLDNKDWVVVSAFNTLGKAEAYAREQNCEYIVTSVLANLPKRCEDTRRLPKTNYRTRINESEEVR
jgi:hypothetical protein